MGRCFGASGAGRRADRTPQRGRCLPALLPKGTEGRRRRVPSFPLAPSPCTRHIGTSPAATCRHRLARRTSPGGPRPPPPPPSPPDQSQQAGEHIPHTRSNHRRQKSIYPE
eukprot:9482155-Pyramimonas_sp.AAC.1